MIYYKRKDIEKFITSKNGKYIVTSYGALLLVYAIMLLILTVIARVIWMTFFTECAELSVWDSLSGIAALIGGVGVLAWGKSFDVKAANNEPEVENLDEPDKI